MLMFPGSDPTVVLAPATFAPVLGSPAAAKAELTVYNFLPEALSAPKHWFLCIVNSHLYVCKNTPGNSDQLLNCVQLFETPRAVNHQVPLSMAFSRQEY